MIVWMFYETENTSPKSKVNDYIKIENNFNFTDKQIKDANWVHKLKF